MRNRFAALGALFGIAFVAACTATPIDGAAQKKPPTPCDAPGDGVPLDCTNGTHFDGPTCSCVPNGTCPDPGICGSGLSWDTTACACEPVTCTIACPYGTQLDSSSCACVPIDECLGRPCPIGSEWSVSACSCITLDGGPPPACFIPGYGSCGYGQTCVVGYCDDGTSPITCFCDAQGNASCGGVCDGPDGGPPPPPLDGGPQPDAGQGCWLPGYGYCAPNTSCITGYCPDNVTPVSCFCEGNGVSQCTGACPTNPPIDAGSGH